MMAPMLLDSVWCCRRVSLLILGYSLCCVLASVDAAHGLQPLCRKPAIVLVIYGAGPQFTECYYAGVYYVAFYSYAERWFCICTVAGRLAVNKYCSKN